MAIPVNITDLSTTAASNSPAGSESPEDGDGYLRAHAAFIAANYENKAPKASPTFTGTVTAAALTATGVVAFGATSIVGDVAVITGANGAETWNVRWGGDTGTNPNLAYQALNWTTGTGRMEFRVGGAATTNTVLWIGGSGSKTVGVSVPSTGTVEAPIYNNFMTFGLTSDTQLTFIVRGSDGVQRTATITLA